MMGKSRKEEAAVVTEKMYTTEKAMSAFIKDKGVKR